MFPMMLTWAPVAFAGEFFTMLFKLPRSHASRNVGLSVLPRHFHHLEDTEELGLAYQKRLSGTP